MILKSQQHNEPAFEIIDQQDDFIIVNKMAGINFHDENNLGQGLFNQVVREVTQKTNETELYPVHRLDKMTSGLVIFARNLVTAQQFQQLFAQHKIEKYYLAISDQKPKKKQGLIKGDMEKGRRGSWKLLRSEKNPAISQFFSYALVQNTVDTLTQNIINKNTQHKAQRKRLYLIKPHSGKSHQIRVALKSIGAAIIGDQRYYSSSKADRGYLHAYGLRFTLHDKNYHYVLPPTQGELFTISSVQEKLKELQMPWQLNWPNIN